MLESSSLLPPILSLTSLLPSTREIHGLDPLELADARGLRTRAQHPPQVLHYVPVALLLRERVERMAGVHGTRHEAQTQLDPGARLICGARAGTLGEEGFRAR